MSQLKIDFPYDQVRGICKEVGFHPQSMIVFGVGEEGFRGHSFYIKESQASPLITIMFKTIISESKASGKSTIYPNVSFGEKRLNFKYLFTLKNILKPLKVVTY